MGSKKNSKKSESGGSRKKQKTTAPVPTAPVPQQQPQTQTVSQSFQPQQQWQQQPQYAPWQQQQQQMMMMPHMTPMMQQQIPQMPQQVTQPPQQQMVTAPVAPVEPTAPAAEAAEDSSSESSSEDDNEQAAIYAKGPDAKITRSASAIVALCKTRLSEITEALHEPFDSTITAEFDQRTFATLIWMFCRVKPCVKISELRVQTYRELTDLLLKAKKKIATSMGAAKYEDKLILPLGTNPTAEVVAQVAADLGFHEDWLGKPQAKAKAKSRLLQSLGLAVTPPGRPATATPEASSQASVPARAASSPIETQPELSSVPAPVPVVSAPRASEPIETQSGLRQPEDQDREVKICVICQGDMPSGLEIELEALRCAHVYHRTCLDSYCEATGKTRENCCPLKCNSMLYTVGETSVAPVANSDAGEDEEAAADPESQELVAEAVANASSFAQGS